jgi:hypothetical protein
VGKLGVRWWAAYPHVSPRPSLTSGSSWARFENGGQLDFTVNLGDRNEEQCMPEIGEPVANCSGS